CCRCFLFHSPPITDISTLSLHDALPILRVSVLPTMFGESVVIRVLDRTVVQLDLDKIGMEEDMLVDFRKLIKKPNGIILITGPRSEEHTSELQSLRHLVCRLLLEKKNDE